MSRIRCVWWNVDNLYPFVAGKSDDYRPGSEAKYQSKLQALAGVLSNAPGGVPDLVLLAEIALPSHVGGRNALDDLAAALGGTHSRYLGTRGDGRGITCGALWTSALKRGSSPILLHDVMNHAGVPLGRPIVELPMREASRGRDFVVYLNHWASRKGDRPRSEPKRTEAGKKLVGLVQERVCTSVGSAADPDAMVIAVGDFNDEPFNAALTDPTGAEQWEAITRDRTRALARLPATDLPVLYNPSWRLLAEPLTRAEELARKTDMPVGSLEFGDWWCTFDQLLVSAGTLCGPNPVFDESGLCLHAVSPLVGPDGHLSGTPSDHLPLCFTLDF